MIDYILFEISGRPVLLIDLISSILGLACVFLAGRNSKYNFWVGYLYTVALFFLFWNRNLYPASCCNRCHLQSISWDITAGRIQSLKSSLRPMLLRLR